MASIPTPGYAADLLYSENGSDYTAVAEISNLRDIGADCDDIEITSHDSEERWVEVKPGLCAAADVGFDIVYHKTLHNTLVGYIGIQFVGGVFTTPMYWKITLSDGADFYGTAYLASLELTADEGDINKGTGTITFTGQPTYSST